MDRISVLTDDLILKILSMIPTKVAVTTSVLSKRWCSLWKHVPQLSYSDPFGGCEFWRASRFVEKFLLLHEAPVLDTLTLILSRNCPPTDISTWISIAVSRGLRNLQLYMYGPCSTPIRLPRSLYTCQTLVSLILQNVVIVDVPLTICFGSLKTMYLERVDVSDDENFGRLLSGCTVLESLIVNFCSYDKTFTVDVPSLKSLLVLDLKPASVQVPGDDDAGVVIKAPSLSSLMISDQFTWVCSLVDMPKLVNASIKLAHSYSKKLAGCLTSAKHLCLCVKSPVDSFLIGVFHQLVSLNLCTCTSHRFFLLLSHTPKLRVLRFQPQGNLPPDLNALERCCSSHGDFPTPSCVPECLISSLETVEWIDYRGTEAETKVVKYLFENSQQLKKMAIRCLPSIDLAEKHKMLIDLASTQRSSSKCQLSFT
ncbi:unnamed protein product [Microthlaspi erraticum]|uniref:FBD domain-containing protein n=1 Tax=Microthlaspi erraticum TaxID=1685480 RepID=A0A6D2KZM7_9BRAS|nr:unnamed protein product [Microthlaspi erraticum]